MKVLGSNDAYGSERVELSRRRTVMPVDTEAAPFPAGMGDLIPVISLNRHGEERVVHAFPTATGDGSSADPEASAPAPALTPALERLEAALDLVNDVLEKASDILDDDLGSVVGAYVEIPEKGYGFTRAEEMRPDVPEYEDGTVEQGAPHTRLTVETSPEPGSPLSATCVVDYDSQGRPEHISTSLYDEDGMGLRIAAEWRHHLHEFVVAKIETLGGRLIYKIERPKKWRQRNQ